MTSENYYYHKKARRRVKAKKGFYYHLGVYIIMSLFFFAMNLAADGFRDLWFFFPLIPWGSALLIHYLIVFGFPVTKILSKDWEERQIEKELSFIRYESAQENPAIKPAIKPGKYEDPLSFDKLKVLYQEKWNNDEFV